MVTTTLHRLLIHKHMQIPDPFYCLWCNRTNPFETLTKFPRLTLRYGATYGLSLVATVSNTVLTLMVTICVSRTLLKVII